MTGSADWNRAEPALSDAMEQLVAGRRTDESLGRLAMVSGGDWEWARRTLAAAGCGERCFRTDSAEDP